MSLRSKLSRISLSNLKLKLRRSSGKSKTKTIPKPQSNFASQSSTAVGDELDSAEASSEEEETLVSGSGRDDVASGSKPPELPFVLVSPAPGSPYDPVGLLSFVFDEDGSIKTPVARAKYELDIQKDDDKTPTSTSASTFEDEENRRDVEALRFHSADSALSDEEATLAAFLRTSSLAATSTIDLWAVDMRLTLLWCLAFEARFRRRQPAVALWLAIISGGRDADFGHTDWGMWIEGDERYLREAIIAHPSHAYHLRTTASILRKSDWIEAWTALRSRESTPKKDASNIDYVKTLCVEDRVLRITWLAVTDGIPIASHGYTTLRKQIDFWMAFTVPFRPAEAASPPEHDLRCPFGSSALWLWLRTAIVDYIRPPNPTDRNTKIDRRGLMRDVGCCEGCLAKALRAHAVPFHTLTPAIWPAILWVAFQLQTRDSSKSRSLPDFLSIINANQEEHMGLWAWDDEDEQMLRSSLGRGGASPSNGSSVPWTDGFPAWRQYLDALDDNGWKALEGATRRTSRVRLQPAEYDAAVRLGGLLLWVSSSPSTSKDTAASSLLASLIPRPRDSDPALAVSQAHATALEKHQFLRHFLIQRSSSTTGTKTKMEPYKLHLDPEPVDWNFPWMWLTKNKDVLRRNALQDPELVSYTHVAENVYMISHVRRALPLRFMSCVFAGLLKTCNNNNSRLDDFRSKIQLWKAWDTMTCLINFRVVLSTTFELSKLIKEEDLPRPMINVAIHTDILCVCAQLADVLRDAASYLYFVRTKDEDAQKLLDLIQDLLDYPLLDDGIRPGILKALLKLSAKSGLYPRCFALSDRLQLEGNQIAAGSFGDVWKGTIGSEIVSVKVMRVYEEGDVAALLKEFYHEALIWRQLSHPNLLPFLGAYYLEGSRSRLCLVSPWMEKGNIVRYLKNNPVGINKLSLVLDVALGLEHLHRLKLVHGDLKAINVLANSSGQAVLADFGLSSVIDSKILLSTSTVKMGGTVRWQAPELFTGTKNSFPSDIYAFACVCYEIFTGYVPFWELTNDVAVMFQVIQGQRPKRSPGNIPEKVWRLMTECWDGDPEKRPSAPQVVFTLRDRGIGAVPTSETADWDAWYTSKFRSSLEEHTLFLSCGSVDDWQQFTRMQKEEDMLGVRRALYGLS